MFLVDRTLRLRSCRARSALKGPLRPSSHRPADLRGNRLLSDSSLGHFSDKCNVILNKRQRDFFWGKNLENSNLLHKVFDRKKGDP